MALRKTSRIAWTSLLSGLAISEAALYPTASLGEQVSTSASSLPTVEISQAHSTFATETLAFQASQSLEAEQKNQVPATKTPATKASGVSELTYTVGSETFSVLPNAGIQPLTATPSVLSQQPSEPTPAPAQSEVTVPTSEQIQQIQDRLKQTVEEAEETEDLGTPGAVPAFTLFVPSGYGADRNTVFVTGVLQTDERTAGETDGALSFGVGLLDSSKIVGLELSYALLSFGTVEGGRDFGDGTFNIKVHKQFPNYGLGVAVGYNGLVSIGADNDLEDSPYGSVTKFFILRPDLDKPFSRLAVTAGAGSGQFRLEGDVADDEDTVSPFGSVAVRIARSVSAVTEWSGQDLGAGLSFAFRLFPETNFVITPTVRDIVGAGDGPRFVLGAGVSYRF